MKKPSGLPTPAAARNAARHLVATLLLVAAVVPAGAAQPDGANPAGADHSAMSGPEPTGAVPAVSAEALAAAVDRLSQAALQSGLASDSREIALLHRALDGLESPEISICCALRARVAQLDAELARVIAREERQSVTLDSSGGAITNMPSRDELNALAREGQDLIRGEPAADAHWRDRSLRAAHAEIPPLALAQTADSIASAGADRGFAAGGGPAALPLFTMRF